MSKKKDVVYSQPNEQSRNFSDTATKNQFYNTRDSFGLEGKKSSVHSAQNQNQLHDQQNGGNGDNNVEIMKKDPLQYYKTKSQLLSDRVSILQGENERLRIDNAHLRNLNMDYVKQLNTISHEKTTRNEQIIITPQFFESEENSAQDFIRKLANNYRLLQKEQKQLIQHCQVMERDLEIYKTQIGDAENILEKLRKTGETSIQNLIFQLKDQNMKLEQEIAKKKEVEYELDQKKHIIQRKENDIQSLIEEKEGLSEELEAQKSEHLRIAGENDERIQKDRQQQYMLKFNAEFLEQENRTLHSNMINFVQDQEEAFMKIKEVESQNENLKDIADQFYKTKGTLLGTFPKFGNSFQQ